jgi:hypothetical protein
LSELEARFARFRKEHRRGTRIPIELRKAVLAAVRQVPPDDIYRACGVSFRQVMTWKGARAQRAAEPDVRVFTVVDEEAVAFPEPEVSAFASGLELRFGPWSVSVRLVDDAPEGRGAACCR